MMYSKSTLSVICACMSLLLVGCTSTQMSPMTNQRNIGTRTGNVIGTAVGATVGTVSAIPVATVESAAAAIDNTATNDGYKIRHWEKRQTADGRIIQVPVDVPTNAQGDVVR